MTDKTDILIIGAGMVGAAQALALAKYDIASVVVDQALPQQVMQAGYDGRVSAISHASVQVLEHIGIWPQLAVEAGPMERIRVTEGGRLSDILFDINDIGSEPFGYMVANHQLRKVLLQAVMESPLIRLVSGYTVAAIQQQPFIQVTLTNQETLHPSLLLVADGRYSSVREKVGIGVRKYEYNQKAIVCTITHTLPHDNIAIEWFFPVGPLAILPMHGGHRSCIVWTEESAMADHLVALEDAEFIEELALKLNGVVGEIRLEGRRYSYPLNLFQADTYITQQTALIGDAAHAIHPIAGQGVNLGYRDVAVLTEILVDAKRQGMDMGSSEVLSHYQRWRSFDVTTMIAVTDGLNRIFSTSSPLVRTVRRAGMAAFGRTLPVKHLFMEVAMGMAGDLPKMLQGEAI